MDPLLVSLCLTIYNDVLATKLGKYIVKKFQQMPKDSIYFSLFTICRNNLKNDKFTSINDWLNDLENRFNQARRALDPKNDLSIGLETIVQILKDKILTKRSSSTIDIASEIAQANEKVRQLLPLFPDNLEEFKELLAKDEPKFHVDLPIPETRKKPSFNITELDILVSKLRNLKTDKQVADVMDILQHYEILICQDSDEEISVNFNTLDPFTTEKVKQYTDSLTKSNI